MKTKIEWADYTYNPVWGCNAGCEYCYARNIARRFAYPIAEKETGIKTYSDIPDEQELKRNILAYRIEDFKPVWLQKQFDNFKFPKKKSRIFIGSMSDIAYWKDEWIEKLTDKIKQYSQHNFLLLTKFPKIYKKLDKIMPENVWFGVTVTREEELERMLDLLHAVKDPIKRKFFTSFEPLIEYIPTKTLFGAGLTDWVIIGAMSGSNKQKTKTEWIGAIVSKAREYNVPVFVKQIVIDGKIEKDIKKFPEELQYQEFHNI